MPKFVKGGVNLLGGGTKEKGNWKGPKGKEKLRKSRNCGQKSVQNTLGLGAKKKKRNTHKGVSKEQRKIKLLRKK